MIVKQRIDKDIYVNYSKKEIVSRVEDLEHELVREAMWMTGVTNGVEITTLAGIPSAGGSGLGSPSAATVGFAARPFRVSRAPGNGRGTGRPCLHDRDRPLREAHRQAGSVHCRLRRHRGHPASGPVIK